MSTDPRTDLRADLLADLVVPEPAPPAEEPAPPAPRPTVTPAVSLQWTPLRWSRPRVMRATTGPGRALRLGPLSVELAVTE